MLADLHSSYYGEKQIELISEIQKLDFDLIFLAGDIVDDKVSLERGFDTIRYIKDKTKKPIYYVTGNHDGYIDYMYNVKEHIKNMGVNVLEGNDLDIDIFGNNINILGYDDRTIGIDLYYKELDDLKESIKDLKEDSLKLLISHRPEKHEEYEELKADYVFSGHAHGGQWKTKKGKTGMYAPGQGMFPKYVDGLYKRGTYSHIITPGLARDNTKVPRIFNPPCIMHIKFSSI